MDGGLMEASLDLEKGRTVVTRPRMGGVAGDYIIGTVPRPASDVVTNSIAYDFAYRETERRIGKENHWRVYDKNGDLTRRSIANSETKASVASVMSYDAHHRVISSGTTYCSVYRYTAVSGYCVSAAVVD